jgi:hypothetical protein
LTSTDKIETIALGCPSCGAGMRVREQDRIISCSHCGAEHFLSGINGTVRSIIPFSLTEGDAKRVVYSYFRKRETAQDIPRQGQLKEITPIYVPFWKVREGYYGWRFRPGLRPQVIKRVVEVTVPACATGGLGFTSVRIEPEDLRNQKLYEPENAQREATVYDVTIPKEDILELTKRRALGKTEGKGSSSIFFQRIKCISTSALLVYYPLWLVKYSYNRGLYQVVVNGRRGLVVSGRFPANLSVRLGPLISASALGGFLATSIFSLPRLTGYEELVGPFGHLIAGALVISGAIVFIQLFQAGLAALRYGREVRIEDTRRVDMLPEYTGMVEEMRSSLRDIAREFVELSDDLDLEKRSGFFGGVPF